MPFPELPERVWNHTVPRRVLSESDPQRPRLATRHTLRASGRLIHLLKYAPRILKKQLARRAYLHTAPKAVKQLESNLLLQILNLAREGRLSHAQPLCGAPVMLLLADGHKISQMPQFHTDTLSLLDR